MTRARIYSQSGVGGGAGGGNVTLATLSPFLTTANVVELTNLYFTNARVFANLQLASIDALRDVNTANSSNGQALIWNSTSNVWAPGNVATSVTLDTLSPFLTTANVTESNSNLYYTNTRARTALTAADPTIIIDVVAGTIRANIAAVSGAANTTDGLPEGFTNQYFTNAKVNAFIQPWLTTANVRELGNNLYFTNARVQTAISLANLVDIGDVVYTGTPSNNQVLTWNSTAGYWTNATANAGSAASFAERANVANTVLTLLNFTTFDLNPDPNGINPYFSNTAVLALFSPGGNTQITTSNIAEGSNLYFTNARVNLLIAGSTANAIVPYLTTANVRETTNLYYTNARVVSAVLPYLTTANVLESDSNLYYTNTRVNAFIQPYLTTANVLESNTALYYTNARVISFVQPYLTTANVLESDSNLYYTNTRVIAHLANSNVSTKFLSVTGNIYATENVTTSKSLVLSKNAGSSSAATGSGIYIEGADASILYNDSTGSIDVNKTIIVTGNILPSVSGIFNIGSAAKKFRSIFLGTQTIFLGDIALGQTDGGGLSISSSGSGLPVDGSFGNVIAVENIVVSRFTNAANSSTEANVYFGGNVAQFITNRTGNIYYGIKKNDNWNNFAGIRVQEKRIVPLPVYPTYTWNVANSFATDYIFSGYSSGNDIPITITAGDTIVFNVNAPTHDLWIKTAQVTGTGSGVTTGNITNNGTDAGNVIWNTTGVVPGTYYYNSANDASMGGTITVLADTQPAGNVRSDVIIYNDNELTNSSVARISVLGDGNTLFYGNVYQDSGSQLFANLVGNVTGRVSTLDNHTTANLREGTSLYYTNSRVRSTLSSGTGVTYDSPNGVISIGQDVATTADVTFNSVTITSNLTVYGNVTTYNSNNISLSDNMIYLNNGSNTSNPDIGFAFNYNDGVYHHGGFFRDASDGKFKVFDNYTPEPDASIFIDTANASFRLANIQATTFFGNLSGTVDTLSNFTTANLVEGINLYYTNARVLSTVIPYLTTSNVVEGSNLYYTNARVLSIVTPLLTTSNVVEGSNLYYTNARVLSIVTPLLTTSNVAEGSNLYYTNARVYSNVIALLPTLAGSGIQIQANGQINSTASTPDFALRSNIANTVLSISNFTTANLAEGSNLYYTNARVISAVTPYLTTANVIETSSNLYYTNARVFANVAQMSINVLADVDITGIATNGILTWNGTAFVAGTVGGAATSNVALIAYQADHANTADNSNVANSVLSISNFTTANLAEGINLYYTNSRVLSIVTPLLTTSNVAEGSNLYYTNARVFANVAQMSVNVFADVDITGIQTGYSLVWNGNVFVASAPQGAVDNANIANTVLSISNFTTANLVEGNNLYYTNARVLSALTDNVTIGNLKVSTALNYSNTTGVVKVYQYYNEANLSLDTIFL
jgi:hypothetical protein